MALTLQNLRAVGTGVEPTSLLPGQIAFNVTDKVIYVGDGSSFKTDFDGTQVAGVPGEGWYAMPMDFSNLGNYYVANPEVYGDSPTDLQVLTWSEALNHPVWTTGGGGGGGGGQVYVVTNAQVAAAPGATTSAKISAAIGVASPDQGNVAIVTGLPDDVYEGLYFFSILWVKGASYAYPSASEVIYNNVAHPTLGATVQVAIDDLDTGLGIATSIANTANSTANSALSIASAALPRSGGTMTGPLISEDIDVPTGFSVLFAGGTNGTLFGVTNSTSTTSSNLAASATAVKSAYDLADAAIPDSSFTAAGQILVGTGAGTYSPLTVGANGDVLVVSGGTPTWIPNTPGDVTSVTGSSPIVVNNADPENPVVSINAASTTTFGAVQLNDTTTSTSTTEAATANAVKVTKDAADAAQATADAAVPRSSYAADGDILVGTGTGTFGPLAVGTENQVLTIVSGTPAWTDDAPGDVTSVAGTAPIQVDNTDPQTPTVSVDLATTATPGVVQIELTGNINLVGGVINVPDASTTVKGAVSLNNTLSSNSTTEALTAAQGLALQQQIDALLLSNSVTLAGGYDATTGLVDGVTSQGTLAGFADGAVPPTASATNVDHYLICIVSGNTPSAMENGDWLLSVETSPGVYAYQVLGVGARPASASYTQSGIVQLADAAAVLTGTSDTTAITPQALQDNVLDSVTTTNSSQIASSTAVKTAYDAGVQGQTDAAAALAVANAALPKAGGTMSGTLTSQNINVLGSHSIQFAGGVNGSVDAISNSTSTTSSTTAASSTAVKSAYDLANTSNTTANAALPLAGGTMTGNITFQNAGEGVSFNGGSFIRGISDATGNTNNDIAASSTAVKDAYALADAALPKAGGTMTGAIVFVAGQTLPISGIQDATTGQKGVVQVGTNIDVTAGTISVKSSTTAQAGIVQLNNTATSTSITEALTANQGRLLQEQITALSVSSNITLGGTFDATTGLVDSVTTQGTTAGLVVGQPLPAPGPTNNEIFVIVDVQGTNGPNSPTLVHVGDWFLSDGVSWVFLNVGFQAAYASTTAPGVVTLSTDAATQAGTDATLAVTPSTLQSKVSDSTSTTSSTTLASSTAVKTAYDLANAAVPKACYTAFGALAAGTGSGTVGTLSVGTNGQSLVVDTTCPAGLKWGQSLAGYTCTATPFNTALGTNAGDSITTGVNNTSLGYNSGTAITNGNNNTFVGFGSGDATTSSDNNTALGANALGGGGVNNNTGIGYNAGCSLTTGTGNTFLGGIAGDNVTTADYTVAVGYNALGAAHTANGTVAIGANTLAANTSGAGNTAVGFNSGVAITTGSNNTILGFNAGDTISTGTQNTFVGACSGGILAGTSEGNTGIGFSALGQGNTSGAYNVAVGTNAGLAVTSGAINTLVGFSAGSAITTGGSNTLIGRYAGTAALANNVVLSDGAGTIRFQSNASGAVSLGAGGAYGTAGQYLASQGSAAAPVWCTLSLACIPCAAFTASGELLAGTGAGTFTALSVGTSGQFLVADSTCTGGLKWATSQGANLCGFTCTATPFNTVLGGLAGAALTGLSVANTAIGYAALDSETSGDFNTAIGHNALTAQNGSTGNTAVGGNAGAQVTTGSSNTLMGYNAGDALTNGAQNTAIGVNSLGTNLSGTSNVAVGSSSLQSSTGSQNTAVGNGAGCAVTIGTGHVYVGYLAGSNSTSSCNNTFVGWNSGSIATGACNTFIGNNSGSAVTTGSCNTLVGRYTGTAGLANNVVLSDGAGNIRFQSNDSGAISLGAGGAYGTAGQTLQSNGTAAVPTWVTPQTVSTTATKAVTNATPVNLLSWSSGVRMGGLIVMATDNSTNVAWANATIASSSGIGSSVVVSQSGTFGTFAVIAGGSGETIVQFTPSATLATVDFVYKYTVSFGTQPTVL